MLASALKQQIWLVQRINVCKQQQLQTSTWIKSCKNSSVLDTVNHVANRIEQNNLVMVLQNLLSNYTYDHASLFCYKNKLADCNKRKRNINVIIFPYSQPSCMTVMLLQFYVLQYKSCSFAIARLLWMVDNISLHKNEDQFELLFQSYVLHCNDHARKCNQLYSQSCKFEGKKHFRACSQWALQWKMSFNLQKCELLRITI